MASEDSLPVLKILLIGPSGAGKSAYCEDQFDPESTTATIGIDFKTKKLAVRGKGYKLNIFDTAGQERFRTLSTSYYRGAHGVVLVYDISNKKSFASMEKWVDEARMYANPDAVLYFVGTKSDKAAAGGRAVTAEEGRAFAEAQGAVGFCEISSKTRENIKRPFVEVVDQIVQKPELVGATAGTKAINLDMASLPANPCSC
ncbi:ras family-domain-containing protein [Astrocystis sublimbata]|nr:ras family-domain-containing protein [Astrocystis sublimbata]